MNARGKVKWFNDRKGFGFIIKDGEPTTADSDVFVRFSHILDPNDGYRTLQEGQRVRFDLVEGKDGREMAENVVPEGGSR